MSGVHASCVEEWVRRHRASARDDAPPRCSVCHQPYQGAKGNELHNEASFKRNKSFNLKKLRIKKGYDLLFG